MRPEFLLRLWRYKSITYLLTYCIQVAGLRVVKTRHVAERQNALVYFTTLQASRIATVVSEMLMILTVLSSFKFFFF